MVLFVALVYPLLYITAGAVSITIFSTCKAVY